ncbi:MAG: SDR family oxidoreductase [Pseudomonadota bacterium]
MQELSGKTAIITGASKGIGEAATRYMASLGVNVVLAARSESSVKTITEEIIGDGGSAIGSACDVSDYDQVKTVVDLAVKTFGGVDILVNNAGLIDPISRLEDSDPSEWDKVIDVNVKGVYYGAHATLPYMKKKGSGVIINISSGAATSALEGWSHYCSSKAAALSLTRCIHREEAENGIRVVGLSPGTVATDMQVAIKASGINPVSQLDPSVHIPPEWVAKTIAWLATDDAQSFDGDDVSLRDEEIRKRVGLA